ncbi:MAG: phosphoribosylformylglycinamidine synthase subunit PurS [Aigarchaeota archaeon]|nr:phosphoribosylformylglycinamidine synthase subunit PurS [Aigarchaeota archaeon]MDW8092716.1 phosphoribosylformylglycinamidine synthase subunit PurS [Nitrososphaerota archaeon]
MGDVWTISVLIELKPSIRDPEGETILRDLIRRGGEKSVEEVRAAKLLRFKVRANNREEAENLVRTLCDELRLYNPIAHVCNVWSDR